MSPPEAAPDVRGLNGTRHDPGLKDRSFISVGGAGGAGGWGDQRQHVQCCVGPSVEVSHTIYWLSMRRARSTARVWCHGASAVITTTSDNSFVKPVSNNSFEIAVGGVFFCFFVWPC